MTTDQNQETFEKLMSAHHGRMIDFVKFAETKNAALLTFCSAWMAAVIGMLRSGTKLPFGYDWVAPVVLVLLAIAAFIALKSFLPRFLREFHESENGAKNLLFFGDIATMSAASFRDKVKEQYSPQDGQALSQAYMDDLLVQIAVQAQIADRKFKAFKLGAGILFLAGVTAALPAAWQLAKWIVSIGIAHGCP